MSSSSWLQKKNKIQKQSKQQQKAGPRNGKQHTWGHWNQQAGPPRVGAADDSEQHLCPGDHPPPGIKLQDVLCVPSQGRDCTYSETHTAVKMNKLEPGLPMKEGRRHVNTQHDTLPTVQRPTHRTFQGTQM